MLYVFLIIPFAILIAQTFFGDDDVDFDDFLTFFVFNVPSLIIISFSVIKMRQVIKSTDLALPNEKLIQVHLANFFLWLLIYAVVVADSFGKNDESDAAETRDVIYIIIEEWFFLYMYLFLLYLITRFGKACS